MVNTTTTVTFDPPHHYWNRDKIKTWISRHNYWDIPPGHTIKYDFIDIPSIIKYKNRNIRVYDGELEMIDRCLPIEKQYIIDVKQIFDELMGRVNLNFVPCRDFLSEELNLHQRLRGYIAKDDLKNPQIRIGFFTSNGKTKNPMGADELAYTHTPGDKFAADIWVDVRFYEKGTVAHEVGHTLGLMHSMSDPWAYDLPRTAHDNPYDNQLYTCMSYSGCATVSPGNDFIHRTMAWVAKKHNLNLRRSKDQNEVHKLCANLEDEELRKLAALFTDIEIKHLGRRSSFGPLDLEILASIYGPGYKKVSHGKTFKVLGSGRLDVYSERGKLRDTYGPGQILNEPGFHTLDLSDLDLTINQTDIYTHGDIGIGSYKHAFSLQQDNRVIRPFLSQQNGHTIMRNRYQGQKYVKHSTIVNNVIGSLGNDRIAGGSEDNTFYGGQGNDTLIGGRGKNLLDGGDGNDKLISYSGDDTLIGGQGEDCFYFHKFWGHDTLTDQHGKSFLFFVCCRPNDIQHKYDAGKEILFICNARTKSTLNIHHFNKDTYHNFNFILRNPGQKDKQVFLGKKTLQKLQQSSLIDGITVHKSNTPIISSTSDGEDCLFFTGCQTNDLRYAYNRNEQILNIYNMKTNSILHIHNFNKNTYQSFHFALQRPGQENTRLLLNRHIKKLDKNEYTQVSSNNQDSISVRTVNGNYYLSFINCKIDDLRCKYNSSVETLDVYNIKTNDVLRINRFNRNTYRKFNSRIKNSRENQIISLKSIKKLQERSNGSSSLIYVNNKITVLFA